MSNQAWLPTAVHALGGLRMARLATVDTPVNSVRRLPVHMSWRQTRVETGQMNGHPLVYVSALKYNSLKNNYDTVLQPK
jgi:hypothetical protein